MFEPVIAPSNSLLGLLQRGRGDGQLHALAADRDEAIAALEECVTSDPRGDWQVENRSLYYARVYMDLEAPLGGIERHLSHLDDLLDPDDQRTGLALAVLGHLAGYGRRDALLLLRQYAETGSNWAWALDELGLRDEDAALLALAPAVLSRFPETPQGEADLRAAIRAAYEPRPWRLWAEHHQRIADASEQSPFDLWQRQLGRGGGVTPGWSVTDVLAWADQAENVVRPDQAAIERRAAAASRCLAAVARPEDRDTLLAAARDGAEGARRAVLRHLVDQDDEALTELIEAAAADPDQRVVRAALDALARMRGPRALARARRWADPAAGGVDSALGEAAVLLLADIGESADAPALVAGLRQWMLVRGVRAPGLGGLVDGAGRLAAVEAVPILRHVYGEAASSDLRGRAARALAVTDPYFACGVAVECLWDCEETTRELAAHHVVTTGDARVLERLRRLAADPAEEAEVHAAVRGRLTSRGSAGMASGGDHTGSVPRPR
ncbi:HEAT repeat domain-containing protein [Kitasatospora sp. NBC_01287]|uniref:HEAT repeat domain-containing protein n=1 Tax=Kitasatospora sp. NBC_01287 TaxID=2903573 RepID=UPI0022556D0A|nr:HEAT repeat domain-containing protein [Kitasatospora sp. NBC_01287]MCX4750719.1 HEAT repeat domain-containing protein [Kitasatospora sp. NBC_01287]